MKNAIEMSLPQAARAAAKKRGPWTMPDWMKPYRSYLADYGLGIEALMNDHDSTFFNNEYRAAVIVGLKDQIGLLTRLHHAGRLLPPET